MSTFAFGWVFFGDMNDEWCLEIKMMNDECYLGEEFESGFFVQESLVLFVV